MSSVIRGRAAGGGGSWSEGRSGDVSAIAVRQGGCIKGWRDLWPKIEAARPREGRTLDSYLRPPEAHRELCTGETSSDGATTWRRDCGGIGGCRDMKWRGHGERRDSEWAGDGGKRLQLK